MNDLMDAGHSAQPPSRHNRPAGITAQRAQLLNHSAITNRPTHYVTPTRANRPHRVTPTRANRLAADCLIMTTRVAGMRRAVGTPKHFGATPAQTAPSQGLTATNTKDAVRRRDIFQSCVTNTEKSSVPYKTPSKNHRERTILGVFGKMVYVD